MNYLVCNNCGGYYELQEGESYTDFEPNCNCGGRLYYTNDLDEFLEEYRKVNVNKRFKQRIEDEKKQKSPDSPSNEYYSNKEFILILIGGFFLLLFFFGRSLFRLLRNTEFPLNIFIFIGLITIGLLFFLFFLGTKKSYFK